MTHDEVRSVVKTTLAVVGRVADRTRTPADDLFTAILRTNESRLADAVAELLKDPNEPLTADRVAAALQALGVRQDFPLPRRGVVLIVGTPLSDP